MDSIISPKIHSISSLKILVTVSRLTRLRALYLRDGSTRPDPTRPGPAQKPSEAVFLVSIKYKNICSGLEQKIKNRYVFHGLFGGRALEKTELIPENVLPKTRELELPSSVMFNPFDALGVFLASPISGFS